MRLWMDIVGLCCITIGVGACIWGLTHGLWPVLAWRIAMGGWLLIALVWAIVAILALQGH